MKTLSHVSTGKSVQSTGKHMFKKSTTMKERSRSHLEPTNVCSCAWQKVVHGRMNHHHSTSLNHDMFCLGAFFPRKKTFATGFTPVLSSSRDTSPWVQCLAPNKSHGLLLGMFFEWPLFPPTKKCFQCTTTRRLLQRKNANLPVEVASGSTGRRQNSWTYFNANIKTYLGQTRLKDMI